MSPDDSSAEMLPQGRLPATSLEYLQWHALLQPGKTAVLVEQTSVSYERFYLDALRMTHAVRQLGVKPGQLVAVCTPDPYLHWLLLLACESRGAVSASFLRQEWQATQELLAYADWVLTDESIEGLDAAQQVLTPDWIEWAMSVSLEQAIALSHQEKPFNEAVRLTRSSGSTGKPKLILQDRHRFEYSIRVLTQEHDMTSHSVFLVTAPFVVSAVYVFSCICLRLGATVSWGALAPQLGAGHITHTWMLPRVLNELLQGLPPDWKRPEKLILAVAGGPLPPVLRERTQALLTDNIVVGYATNEVGRIARLTADDQMLLLPGVEMLIVNESGEPVAPGQVGRIAARTAGMVPGYWRQPEETERHFHAGWFFPGDLGRWVGLRRFELLGRIDDVLNLGGIKQSPLPVEDEFLREPKVRDVAVTSAHGPHGVAVLVAVLVVEEGADLAALGQRVAGRLPSWASPMRIISCKRIPRTSAGKVDRPRLVSLLSSGESF